MRKINLRKWVCSVLILLLAVQMPAGIAMGSGEGLLSSAAPTVVKVESENDFTVALRSDGTVWIWGRNYAGQLGNGAVDSESRRYPEKVDGLGNAFIKDIAAGGAFVLALDSAGRIWQWGCFIPDLTSCGSHTPITSPSIVMVDGEPLIAEEINAGRSIAMARTANGEVWTWGSAELAGWGEPSYEADYSDYIPEPSRVVDSSSGPLTDVVQIAGSFDHALALKSDGSVYVWGINLNRALGVSGSDTSLKFPAATKIELPNHPVASKVVASSFANTSIVVTDQGVYGWSNSGRNLGLGYTDAFLPTMLPFLDGLTDIVVGSQHVYGLTAEGGVIRTADPDYGTVALTEFGEIESLFTGNNRIFALASSGTVWTAGENRYDSAYNLLGNGLMGINGWYWETPEYAPMPMLEFDALPPAAESYSLDPSGKRYWLYADFPVGRFDLVVVKLYDDSGNLIDDPVVYARGQEEGVFGIAYESPELVPGHYWIDLYSEDTERNKKSEIVSVHFEIKPLEFKLYLYGAPDEFELDIEDPSAQPVEHIEYDAYPGEFYDLYEFEGYDDISYYLTSKTPGYSLSIDYVESKYGTIYEAFVIPDTEPIVKEYNLEIVDGRLSGDFIYLRDPVTDAEAVEGYKTYFTDAAGNVIQELEDSFEPDYGGYTWYLSNGVDIPEGATYLRLFMIKNGVEQPTYYKLWLEQLPLPAATVKDHHPAVDQLKAELAFNGLEDASRIGFYKIVAEPEGFSDLAGSTVGLIPAGQMSYNLHLPEISLLPRERLTFYAVDKNGFTSLASAPIPVVDDMTAQSAKIDYEAKYDFELGGLAGPDSLTFMDEDPRPGHLAGFVRWTRPSELADSTLVYDIYYGDPNGKILGGLARVRQPAHAPAEVSFRFDSGSVPSGAASLVIVALKSFDYEYDPSWGIIVLNDVIVPSELVRSALGLAPEDKIMLSHVASFVIQQLNAAQPIDVTCDGIFDRRDVRILLDAAVE